MRVKRCPYTPRDLAGGYDPGGVLHVCAKCNGQGANSHQRQPHRRPQCATALNTLGTAQSSVARSATERLASYDTPPGAPLFVQKKCVDRFKILQEGDRMWFVGFAPADNGCDETLAALLRSSRFRSEEPAQ